MSLNIPALAAGAVNKAWAVAASVLTAVTVRDSPVTAFNPVTGTDTVTSWGVSVSLLALLYDADHTEMAAGTMADLDYALPGRHHRALLRISDLAGATELSTSTEILVGADVWKVTGVEKPPGDAIIILSIRR